MKSETLDVSQVTVAHVHQIIQEGVSIAQATIVGLFESATIDTI
jgi:hypothetical protein